MRAASRRHRSWLRQRHAFLAALHIAVVELLAAGAARAQQAGPVNLYRFVLDIEVPESPALVALGLAPTHALSATAPKPFGLSVAGDWDTVGRSVPAAAFEFSPYLLVGGGRRTLERYRLNSVRGRLQRVGTKTVVSLGVADDPAHAGAMRVALAVRATLHDPHDPINNANDLPERVAALLPDDVSPRETDIRGYSDAVDRSLTDAARVMRARPRWIVSAGYGVAGTVRDQTLKRGNIGSADHTLWLTWHRTLDENFDFLLTGQAVDRSRTATDFRIAMGLRRKVAAVDLLGDVYYDSLDESVHGGLAFEVRLARGIRAVLSLSSESDADRPQAVRKLRARSLFRWSSGS